MLKDIPVLQFSIDPYMLKVIRKDLLPFVLRDEFITPPISLETALHNIQRIEYFLRKRVLPLSRANAKIIYNMLHCPQDDGLNIALVCRAVSLLDDYWLKNENDTTKWEHISLRDNSLNEIFTKAALCGEIVTLQGSMHTPETTTNGISAKGWIRENGKLYLYKRGARERREVIASNILDVLNFSHVVYEDAFYDNSYCSKCECLTSDTLSIVDAKTIDAWCARNKIDFLQFVKNLDQQHFYQMCIADYLLANPDRHGGNWGFHFHADTCCMLGLHPLFDHDHAFSTIAYKEPDIEYTPMPGVSMRDAAITAAKHITIQLKRELTENDFLEKQHFKLFMERLKELT